MITESKYMDPLSFRVIQRSEFEFTLEHKEDPFKNIQISVIRDSEGKVKFNGLPDQFFYPM